MQCLALDRRVRDFVRAARSHAVWRSHFKLMGQSRRHLAETFQGFLQRYLFTSCVTSVMSLRDRAPREVRDQMRVRWARRWRPAVAAAVPLCGLDLFPAINLTGL